MSPKGQGRPDFQIVRRIYMTIKVLVLGLMITAWLSLNTLPGAAMDKGFKYEEEIRIKAQQINVSDGISKDEAIILAQNQVLKDNQEEIFVLKSAEVFGENDKFWDKNSWHISFKVKSKEWLRRGIKWCSLHVNKKTGEITAGGCGPS